MTCAKRRRREEHRAAKRRYGNYRRRARYFGVRYEPISKQYVFERDHWRCGICHRKVPKHLKAPHPDSPTLDHIVPMSKGGDHVLANVQLTHFQCNSLKGDRTLAGGEQLALIG